VWVGDTTYLTVGQRWRYLAIVMDRDSRRILAWSLTRRRTATVTCAVLTAAVRTRPAQGVMFRSDRASEYLGAPFCRRVLRLGLLHSASVRGPGDNAHAESFFHSLKAELTRGESFASEQIRVQLVRYIRYYATIRLHSGLGYVCPLAFEASAAELTVSVNESGATSHASFGSRCLTAALLFASRSLTRGVSPPPHASIVPHASARVVA
jgi:transposase InsO family protein